MHRTIGDSFTTVAGKNIFRQEDPGGAYQATQQTYDWANAIQEELANIIEGFGGTLNSPTEAISAMNQAYVRIKNYIDTEDAAGDTAFAAVDGVQSRSNIVSVTTALLRAIGIGTGIDGLRLQKNGAQTLQIGKGGTAIFSAAAGQFFYFDHTAAVTARTFPELFTEAGISPAAGQWYHVFACMKSASPINTAFLADSDPAGGGILAGATGYDLLRRIGSFRTYNNSGVVTITDFYHNTTDDAFVLTDTQLAAQVSVASGLFTDSPIAVTIPAVPSGINCKPILDLNIRADTTDGSTRVVYYWDGVAGATRPINAGTIIVDGLWSGTFVRMVAHPSVIVDTSQQFYLSSSNMSSLTTKGYACYCRGWYDPRKASF
jgi:hypothetical protein